MGYDIWCKAYLVFKFEFNYVLNIINIDNYQNICKLLDIANVNYAGNKMSTLITNFYANNSVTSDISGDVIGDISGNASNDVTGDISNDVIGDISGNVSNDVIGDVNGDVNNDVTSDINGDVNNNINADLIKFIISFSKKKNIANLLNIKFSHKISIGEIDNYQCTNTGSKYTPYLDGATNSYINPNIFNWPLQFNIDKYNTYIKMIMHSD